MFRYDRLEERIKATGKKKVYLCEKIHKAPTYLRDAKKQNTNIKGVELQILADELGTTPEYLTGLSDQKEKPTGNADGQLPHAERRAALSEGGVHIYLDAGVKLTDEQLDDILDFIKFQQGKNGR